MGYLEQVLAAVDNAKRIAGRNISDLVSSPALYAERMTDALRNSNANVVPTAAQGELTNRPMTQDEITQKYVSAAGDTLNGGLGVIKPKGGNWLSGKYGPEAQLAGLRSREEPYVHRNAEGFSVAPEHGKPMPAEEVAALQADPAWARNKAVNSFVDRQLTKYIKNDMASPADPIRKLADAWPAEKATKLAEAEARVQALRQKQQAQAATRGVPEEMLTRTRQDVLRAEEARDLIAENQGLHFEVPQHPDFQGAVQAKRMHSGFPAEGMAQTPLAQNWEHYTDTNVGARPVSDFLVERNLQADPWLAKADPKAQVNYLTPRIEDALGFSHLIDELRNSVREGRLTPEQIQKMPIDQAVRHVAEVNALRAVEANKARAMDMADMPIHKDYPEQGMSWRQLASEDRPKLEKWLKQEGDAMGHCVGGYCDDVAAGHSNIYSLRDAKGKPYTTIETGHSSWNNNADVDRATDAAWARAEREGLTEDMPDYFDIIDRYTEEALRANPSVLPVIKQIKGPHNEAPDPQYFPMIQDFIRSGKWSDVQDAGNTGLTPAEIQQILKGQQ